VIFFAAVVGHAFHIGNGAELFQKFRFLFRGQAFRHDPDAFVRYRGRKFRFHDIHADLHGRIVRQVFGHIVIDPHLQEKDSANDRQDKHQSQDQVPA